MIMIIGRTTGPCAMGGDFAPAAGSVDVGPAGRWRSRGRFGRPNVRGWWTGDVEGSPDKLGDEFTYRYQDIHYSAQKITELIPGEKVVWRVLDAHLMFAEDPSEWAGTEITFEVAQKGEQTDVRFAHLGLSPELDCFDSCSNGWAFYINGSLRRLITTGEGPSAPPWA